MRDLTHPRDAVAAVIGRVYRDRMTTTSGGNVSLRDAAGTVWITPARVDKGRLTRDDVIAVRPDGSADGPHPPSSELPFHQAVYAARPDVRAVVHAHPTALVAFSVCGAVPDTRLFHQAHHVCGEVRLAPYALPGSAALGASIAAEFARPSRPDCVVLENHGVVVGGGSLGEAFQRFEALEFVARTQIDAARLGTARSLTDAQLAEAAARGQDAASFEPGEATAEERDLRKSLSDFVRRGCRQRLLISTEGSFSARCGDGFLVTPTKRDRESLAPADFVLVRGGAAEAGKSPSRAAAAHSALYEAHPGVGAAAFAHPVSATAFSVTDAAFDAATIPESYVFLRDVARVPHGVQYRGGEIAGHVSPGRPAAILENDGALVVGRDVLDAFDRLEVLEATAQAVVAATGVGAVRPMPKAVIDELSEAFGL